MYILINLEDFIFEVKTYLKSYFPNEDIICSTNKESSYDYKITIKDDYLSVAYYLKGKKIYENSANKDQLDYINSIKDQKQKKKEQKLLMKGLIYNTVSLTTNIKQPWGILTGIRPTKVVFYLRKKYGNDVEKIKDILKNKYKISDKKIKLMLDITDKESKIIDKNKHNEVNIYIGIPFCPSKCSYCSFTSFPMNKWGSYIYSYLSALEKEISFISQKLIKNKNIPIRTIYIGGGTPTSLDEKALSMLMNIIINNINVGCIEEFTVEAGRPDTITKEKLHILKENGVNRISINPQTMNQRTLDSIGRNHTVEDIYQTYQIAKNIGFDIINMDLIIGLPGEKEKDIKHTMDCIKKLSPDNLTVHTLANKRGSYYTQHHKRFFNESNEIENMIKITCEAALEMNLYPYYMYRQKNMVGNFENVGYAKKGKECIYNIEIIEEKSSIIALGAGAVSKIVTQNGKKINRIENIKDVIGYINRIDEMIGRKKALVDK